MDHFGIRVSYLAEFVKECGGREALTGMTTEDVTMNIIKSKTVKQSFCGLLKEKGSNSVGIANVFVSHVRSYMFLNLVDVISFHFRDSLMDTVIWIDTFSVNHHNKFMHVWKKAVKSIDYLLVVIDENIWRPVMMTRTWCVLELLYFQRRNATIKIAVSEKSMFSVADQVRQNPFQFFEMLFLVDCRNTESAANKVILNQLAKEFKRLSFKDFYLKLNGQFLSGMLNIFCSSMTMNGYNLNFLKYQIFGKRDFLCDENATNIDIAASVSLKRQRSLEITSCGVKLSYLRKLIKENGGMDAFQDLLTEDVSKKFVMKTTETMKSSLLDLLIHQNSEDVGEAQWFISHAWKYKFLDCVTYMERFFQKEYPEDWEGVVIWFDLICNSQHNVDAKGFDWWANQFSSHLAKIGKILIVTCPVGSDEHLSISTSVPIPEAAGSDNSICFQPYCFRRIWCVFEFYSSVKAGCMVEVSMSEEEESFLLSLAQKDVQGMFRLIRRLLNLRTAVATKATDLVDIKTAIEADIGFDAVECRVFSSLIAVLLRKIGLISKTTRLTETQQIALSGITDSCFSYISCNNT